MSRRELLGLVLGLLLLGIVAPAFLAGGGERGRAEVELDRPGLPETYADLARANG